LFPVLLKCQTETFFFFFFFYLFCQTSMFRFVIIGTSPFSSYAYCKHPFSRTEYLQYMGHLNWNILLSTETSWLPRSLGIKECLIKFVWRCLYVEDNNRFMFLTNSNNTAPSIGTFAGCNDQRERNITTGLFRLVFNWN
jgi:hypothetical protein